MATKLTQTQRKHAIQSLDTTRNKKAQEITKQFNDKPENKRVYIPSPVYPSLGSILLTLAGFENSVELALTGEALKKKLTQYTNLNHGFYSSEFAKPINFSDIEEAKTISAEIDNRYRREVTGRIVLMESAYTTCVDHVMLAENGDEVLNLIKQFEDRNF